MSLTIIALSGEARAGKDTVADLLTEMIDKPITRLAYATTLKEEVAEMFGVSIGVIDILKNDNRSISMDGVDYNIRKTLQEVADKHRKDDSSYYSKKLLDNIPTDGVVIITDMRYLLEYNELKEKYPDTLFIKIVREGTTIEHSDHSSEQEVATIPVHNLIKNNHSINTLDSKVSYILKNKLPDLYEIKHKGHNMGKMDIVMNKYHEAGFLDKLVNACYLDEDVEDIVHDARVIISELEDKIATQRNIITKLGNEVKDSNNNLKAMLAEINDLKNDLFKQKQANSKLLKERVTSKANIDKLNNMIIKHVIVRNLVINRC